MELALLVGLAFMAGLMDAVVGGGGLIQIPALFTLLPHPTPASVFGTNKLASIAGTSVAAVRFARRVAVHWSVAIPATLAAFVCSFIGARTVSVIPTSVVRPVVLVLLIGVAVFTWMRKDFGAIHAPRHAGSWERALALGVGGAIGFYDGFFGPGTGMFLIFLFIRFFGFDFLRASAAAKVVNVATNLAALLYFGASGNVLLWAAVPMAVANVAGAMFGVRMAIRGGAVLIRRFFLLVVSIMILRFAWETFVR